VVKLLLEAEADVNVKRSGSSGGKTALTMTAGARGGGQAAAGG